jgi:hypothetical protein
MLLNRCLGVVLLVAVAGCGGLRRLPITDRDAGPTGSAGSAAGAGGNSGGSGGIAGSAGGSTGTGGSVFNPDGAVVDAPMCVSGGACVPANPCHKGMFVCADGGAMTCMELSDLQANGTVCDADKVCNNGTCTACVAGMACDVTGKPCRVGSIVCTTGSPVCTEVNNKPNGTGCGTGMVCQGGTCATCQAGGACTPTNKCHNGTLVCTGAAPACTDSGTNVAAGTSCGTDMVCSTGGACAACVAGTTCTPPGKPCSRGTIACNTGAPVCIESGNAPNGSVCGTDMVCQGGACAACSAGTICVPANPCHSGIMVCTPAISCTDSGNSLANGASCGPDRVCNAGTCVTCAAGSSCQPTNACKTGTTSCATGSPLCVESGNRANGTPCGTNQVCNAGACMGCTSGGACTPTANPCHTGTLTCTTGAPTCSDSGSNQPDGTACGTNLVCRTGSCVSCTAGQACQPTNPCKNGATSCSTGSMVCTETTNKGAGTLCGAGQSCAGGVLTLPAMCTATGTCSAATMQCPSGTCNTAGTDCATCPTGQTSCPTGCKDLTRDVGNCGQCSNACPAPDKDTGAPVCVASTCRVSCNPGYLACQPWSIAMCQKQMWDFEDMLFSDFRILNDPSSAQRLSVSGRQVHSGKYSMAIATATSSRAIGFQVGLPLCGAKGYLPGKSLMLTVWMLIEPSGQPPALGKATYWGARVVTDKQEVLVKGEPRGYNEWFPVQVPVPDGEEFRSFNVEAVMPGDILGLPDWTGTIYVDDVSITIQ